MLRKSLSLMPGGLVPGVTGHRVVISNENGTRRQQRTGERGTSMGGHAMTCPKTMSNSGSTLLLTLVATGLRSRKWVHGAEAFCHYVRRAKKATSSSPIIIILYALIAKVAMFIPITQSQLGVPDAPRVD